ncbi:hypothetical protein QQF64_031134 [Cirrhinus molitorella]|uniref:C-type lectin domain-containing protein n=1 Tax=Cirrhinus molitorella TaxID=172907 RepID=A0ABR3N595_9TELE
MTTVVSTINFMKSRGLNSRQFKDLRSDLESEYGDLVYHTLTRVTFSQLHDYFFVTESVNWTTARTYCREHYTDLATVNNQQDNDNLLKMTGTTTVWIGLYRTSERKRKTVRVELKSSQNLNDPTVMNEILAKMEQVLKEKGLEEYAKLSWVNQSDGNVFQKKKWMSSGAQGRC